MNGEDFKSVYAQASPEDRVTLQRLFPIAAEQERMKPGDRVVCSNGPQLASKGLVANEKLSSIVDLYYHYGRFVIIMDDGGTESHSSEYAAMLVGWKKDA